MDPILGIIGGAFAALATWAVAVRRMSGKIGSSDADQLWTEARRLRDWSQAQIEKLEARVESLERDNTDLLKENIALGRENRTMADRIGVLNERIIYLESHNNNASEEQHAH